jgi:bifunctional UDP-N-acetylglucosamine pyrophosphorylase/glucosamine-1-phosphate N-acetyltransferase
MTNISVVILAAGKGRRMQSNIPKVLHTVGGKTLLEHVVHTAKTGVHADNIYVVYGHAGERIREESSNLQVTWVEQAEQLGTAHAVGQPLPQIPDDHLVIVLYGDVPLISAETINALIHATPQNGLCLLVAYVPDPTGLGRIIRNDHHVFLNIVEEKDTTPEQRQIHEIFSGILAINAGLLKKYLTKVTNDNSQKEYYLTAVPAIALADGATVTTLKAYQPEEILGINDKEQLAHIERLYQSRQAKQLMLQGAILRDPARVDVRGTVSVGKDTVLDVNVLCEGEIHIGQDCYIGPNVVLKNCRLGDRVTVNANTVIDESLVESDVTIGPFARLRPQTTLASGVHIGNFVEIKKSNIGKSSKVNHLAYVGDSTVGAHVNIGAGVITCNYDGVNKHQTIIGDNAFIGSNVSLVAPISIASGATVGAGSTLTKDVPSNALALSRARQSMIEDWSRLEKNSKKNKD